MTKTCTKCKEELPKILFYRHRRSCKFCMGAYVKNKYQTDVIYRENTKARTRESKRKEKEAKQHGNN